MVALDHGARSFDAHALDHVRVQRALYEVFGIFDAVRVLIEDVDEQLADDFPLLLWICDAREPVDEQLARVDRDQVQVKALTHRVHDAFELALAEQAVVHEDAHQAIAERLMAQHRRDRRIHAAAQAADHALVRADGFGDFGDRFVDERAGGPAGFEPRDLEQERAHDVQAALRVRDFRVELDAVHLA